MLTQSTCIATDAYEHAQDCDILMTLDDTALSAASKPSARVGNCLSGWYSVPSSWSVPPVWQASELFLLPCRLFALPRLCHPPCQHLEAAGVDRD